MALIELVGLSPLSAAVDDDFVRAVREAPAFDGLHHRGADATALRVGDTAGSMRA